MRRPSKQTAGTDILSGIVAVAAFLAMAFPLGMSLGLSVLLAACVYVGMWFVTRATAPETVERVSEADLIDRIGRLLPSVANARVQSRIGAICDQAHGVLAFLEEHPDKAETWRGILRDCLQSTLRIVQRYVELSRFFDDPSRQSLQELEVLLDQVSATFANLRRRLVDEGAADLSAEMELFRSTLQALDEVNVTNRGGSTP